MGSSSYARIAGLQSEVGRVVVTRVAGSEVDFKRQINMYHKDLTVSVNTIRREQIKMRRRNRKYAKKLKQTRIENVKRIEEEQRRDEERALLEELHLRLKAEAAEARKRRYSKVVKETESRTASVDSGIQVDEPVSPTNIQLKEGPVFIETGHKNKNENMDDIKVEEPRVDSKKSNGLGGNKESRPYTVLPMINEDLEKENEEEQSDSVLESEKVNESVDTVDGQTKDFLAVEEAHVTDDEASVSSFGGKKRHKKKAISFSDIIKLKYRNTKQLFDLVHVLAKRHGIQDIEEQVPDPRDNIVHRGASDNSFGLQASFLYPMKYGYVADEDADNDIDQTGQLFPPLNVVSPSIGSEEEAPLSSNFEGRKLSLDERRKLSLDERRQMFLSGKHSRSTDNSRSSGSSSQQSNFEDTQPKLKSKDNSLPLLVERVNQVKLKQRAMSETDNTLQLLSPPKPSSSRSSRSLPPLSQNKGKGQSVSWTQAVGLIRAIRSIET